MAEAARGAARMPAIEPGAPRRGLMTVSATLCGSFVQVKRTFLAPLARVLIPDHPPLRCRWSGTGAVSCACCVQGVR